MLNIKYAQVVTCILIIFVVFFRICFMQDLIIMQFIIYFLQLIIIVFQK